MSGPVGARRDGMQIETNTLMAGPEHCRATQQRLRIEIPSESSKFH